MENISLLLAFSAGLLSFLSPCVLPLVPAYITYLTGSSIAELSTGKEKLNTLYKAFGFVIGFSIVFIIMGASITSVGRLLVANQQLLRKAGGILIIIFGFHITGLIKLKPLYAEKRLLPFGDGKKSAVPIFMGMGFAAGWTPCIGPILSSILIYAGSMNTISKGILLLVFYSLGMAVPFILTALAIGSFTRHLSKLTRLLPVLSVISGVLLIVMGIMMFTNKFSILSRYMDFFPSF